MTPQTQQALAKRNADFAYKLLEQMVGGDIEAYFQSGSTLGMIKFDCEHNNKLQGKVMGYLLAGDGKGKAKLEELKAYLKELFLTPLA
jgi:hypothetical protein